MVNPHTNYVMASWMGTVTIRDVRHYINHGMIYNPQTDHMDTYDNFGEYSESINDYNTQGYSVYPFTVFGLKLNRRD